MKTHLRDLAVLVLAAVLTAFVSQGSSVFDLGVADLKALGNAGLAAAVSYVLMWVTPITRQYGVGSAADETAD